MKYVIIFFVMVFSLSLGFMEAERDTTIVIKYSDEFRVFSSPELVEEKGDYFILDTDEWEFMVYDGYEIKEGTEIYIKK